MSERAARWGLAVVVLLYLAAGLATSVLAPLGEAPDETAHFQYMRYLATRWSLPRSAADRAAISRKGHEPPLYYVVLGLATAWVDTRGPGQIKLLDPERYPRHSLPDETLVDFSPLHTADEQWPFEGAVLAWHVGRVVSLLLMAATLVVVFRIVREVAPHHPGAALVTATAAALTPQFIYIGSSLNNDSLAALLGAAVLWLLLILARGEARWRQFVLLGVLLGLARLTKFYALALVPEAALVLLVAAWRHRRLSYLGGLVVAVALAFAVPAPWLFYIQPVSPVAAQALGPAARLIDIVHVERWFGPGGEGRAGTGLAAVGRALLNVVGLQSMQWAATLFRSYWGYFGAVTVPAPGPVYVAAVILSVLSLAGWVRMLVAQRQHRPSPLDACSNLWVPGLQVLAFLGAEAVFFGVMQRLPDTAQARHLYPALGGLALFLALGWWGLAPRLNRGLLTMLVGAVLLAMSWWCLPGVVHSVAAPLTVRSAPWPDAPRDVQPVSLGDGLLFAGARWQATRPGVLQGQLYWQAAQPPQQEAVVVLELVDGAGAAQAVWAGHPGGSRYPTQAWEAGDYVRQEVSWPLPAPLSAGHYQVRLRLLREGQVMAVAGLGPVDLPVGEAVTALPAGQGPQCLVYGRDSDEAHLRDSVLVTWPGGQVQGLVGKDGLAWAPLARTVHGDQAAFVVSEGVPPQGYTVQGDGPQPAGGTPLQIAVDARKRAYAPPKNLEPCGALFGGAVELSGYQLKGAPPIRVRAGKPLRLRLVWRARGRIPLNYTVFVHLVDAQGRIWGQDDKLPGQEYSTLFWAPGEYVTDEHLLAVDPAAPAGTYQVTVGLYQALGGARAPAVDAEGLPLGEELVLGEVQVAGVGGDQGLGIGDWGLGIRDWGHTRQCAPRAGEAWRIR